MGRIFSYLREFVSKDCFFPLQYFSPLHVPEESSVFFSYRPQSLFPEKAILVGDAAVTECIRVQYLRFYTPV